MWSCVVVFGHAQHTHTELPHTHSISLPLVWWGRRVPVPVVVTVPVPVRCSVLTVLHVAVCDQYSLYTRFAVGSSNGPCSKVPVSVRRELPNRYIVPVAVSVQQVGSKVPVSVRRELPNLNSFQ